MISSVKLGQSQRTRPKPDSVTRSFHLVADRRRRFSAFASHRAFASSNRMGAPGCGMDRRRGDFGSSGSLRGSRLLRARLNMAAGSLGAQVVQAAFTALHQL
jgi:hypothetical protein